MELRPGLPISGFVLVRALGDGGMGEVWEARQTALDRNVALKFIHPGKRTEETIERFRTEARAGGRLNHPNIVAFHDHGLSAGRYWISQELVPDGRTLNHRLGELRHLERLPDDHYQRIAELFVQIAEGLQAAHDAGVVHRDLKPANILVTPKGVPKIGDFGLARLVDDMSLTRGGGGTVNYMSPEQIAPEADPIDGRSDIFSLGAVLYELLTLQRAFEGRSSTAVLNRIMTVDPRDPRQIDARIPRDLAIIAMGALEKRRVDRYQSMQELADDLRRFLQFEPIRRQPSSAWERTRKWVRRDPARAVAAGLGLMLLIGAGAVAALLKGQHEIAKKAELERIEAQALHAIDRGRLEEAQKRITEALTLNPTDPAPHVLLAEAYARYSRFQDAERELAEARAKGLSDTPPDPDDARGHLIHGLVRMLGGKSHGWEAAEKHLALAVELDPDLQGALFPLYQARYAQGDEAGARTALERLRDKLPPEDPFSVCVHALQLELDDNFEGALTRLRELEGLSSEERDELRLHRLLAKNLIELDRLGEAEEELRQHLETFPDDHKALEFLATLCVRRARTASDPEAIEADLEEALKAATRASHWDPHWARPHAVQAEAWLERLAHRDDLAVPPPPEWTAAVDEHLAALEEAEPHHPQLPSYRAKLAFLLAQPPFAAGDLAATEAYLGSCLEHDPDHFKAGTLLAQALWDEGRDEEGLALLRQAADGWNESDDTNQRWWATIQVWTFGYADRTGDVDGATRARDAALTAFSDPEGQWEAMLTLAEFLASPRTAELRDCDVARGILIDWNLPRHLRGNGPAEEYLALVEELCASSDQR